MCEADRDATERARAVMTPGSQPGLKSQLKKRFMEDAVAVAIRSDVDLLRAALRGFHMLEDPQAWLRRPANLAKVLGYWARGRQRNAAAYRAGGEPERGEMLKAIGVAAYTNRP